MWMSTRVGASKTNAVILCSLGLARTFLVEIAARRMPPPVELQLQDGFVGQRIVPGIAGLSRLQAFNVAG